MLDSHEMLSVRSLRRSRLKQNYSFGESVDVIDDDISFLEACQECDEDALYEIIQDGVTYENVNERDKSGRTGLSYACGSGFLPILELLVQVEEVDVNRPDKDGNTPLIFAAQAGHADVVNYLLHNFRRVRIDQASHAGCTALMKASIQGRTRCAKLLLFAGANPNRRDTGRGLCAEEWAKFCGRHACSDAIAKYIHSKKYMLKKTFMMSKEKWSSEPELLSRKHKAETEKPKKEGGWITRHLSFKRKKGSRMQEAPTISEMKEQGRCSSTPILVTTDCSTPPEEQTSSAIRRPSCIDGVVPNINFSKYQRNIQKRSMVVIEDDVETEVPCSTMEAPPPITILEPPLLEADVQDSDVQDSDSDKEGDPMS